MKVFRLFHSQLALTSLWSMWGPPQSKKSPPEPVSNHDEDSICWMRSSVSSYSASCPADWQGDAAKSENGFNCSQNTYSGLDPEKDAASHSEI